MKRVIFTTLMFVVMSSLAFAQTLSVYISGQVTNSATGAPVVNQQVFISSDSTNPSVPGISVVATTNPNGVYQASIPLTSTTLMILFVSTVDCNGIVQMHTVTVSNTMQLTVNFSICAGIQPPPPCEASFTVMPFAANPMKYYFQNTSGVANNYSCQWSFGDGTSATGYNTYHIYGQPGTYTVCLTIMNQTANCWDTVCHTLTIAGNPPPPCNVTFMASPDSANSQLWHFAGTSTNPNTNLLWSFGDGTNGNGPVVQHLYQSPGTYVVCAKVPGSNGTILCYACDTIIVSGNPPLPCNASFTISPVTTNPNKFYFHSTSTGANQFTCLWNFGDGTTATGNNTYHIYSQAGTYTVCLTIMNQSANCWDTVCHTLTVGTVPPPCNADFTAIQDSSGNNSFHFAAINPSLIGMYYWIFGDGTNGYGPVTQHQYLNAGTYVVCLVVSNTGAVTCTACDTIVVGGTPPPPCQASFTFSPSASNPLKYIFTNTSGGNLPGMQIQSYWSFGDGSTASGYNVQHIYPQAGTYTACLIITNPATACVDSVCHTFTIIANPPCNANFNAYPDSTNSGSWHFAAVSPNSGIFQWSFGDGSTGSGALVQHTYTSPGYYVVCLHVPGVNGTISCSYCDTIHVTGITPPPCQANFAFAPCSNSVNCFHFESIPNAPGAQYLWTFGDNTPAVTAPNPYHTFTQPGTYQVCLVVTFPGGCVDSVCQIVTVGTPPPPCNAAFLAIQDSVNNHLYHFFASYPNAAGPFHWSFGDGTFGNGPFAHHVYQNPGYYVVCLQVISPNGQITCSECDTIQVTGNPVPTYHIWGHVFAGANTLLDKGKVRLFRLSLTNVGAQLVATTPVDSAGAYHFYNVPAGAYYIKAKPGPMSQFYGQFLPTYYPHNVFWANATPVVIPQVNNPYNINLKPAQAPVPGPGTIGGMITQAYKFSGSGAPASDVEILLKPTSGDPFIVAESNANGEFIFNDLDYGTYEVYPEVTGLVTIPATITLNANNPSATNINMVISPNQVATGMSDDMENMKMFGVYPNPASSLITMELATELPVDAVLSITDLTGRLVYTENITLSSGKQKFTYDLASFENGTYLLQIRTDQGTVNYRKFSVIK